MTPHELKHIPTYELLLNIEMITKELRNRDRDQNTPSDDDIDVLRKPFWDLHADYNLSTHAFNAINRYLHATSAYMSTVTIFEVLQIKNDHLDSVRNLGIKSRENLLNTIREFCKDYELDTNDYPIFQET